MRLRFALKKGDKIQVSGATSYFSQVARSIQLDGETVESSSGGEEVGIKLKRRARVRDKVYKINQVFA